jgi:hypothetical protein
MGSARAGFAGQYEVDVPFDDHLGEIATSVLHVGAMGEGRHFDSFATTLTAC